MLSRAARGAGARARRQPLEATALVLLGIGGLIFPPIWLVGALVALLSKSWDFRDKWAGLAGPVALVIVSTWILTALGGEQSSFGGYLREAWLSAGHLSRVAAVLGAAYLAWRLQHGRPQRAVPPWTRPRGLG